MRSPRSTRRLVSLITLSILSIAPLPIAGQVVGGNDIQGDWVRVDSNNNPNDLMRITVNGSAVLTSVPAAASPYWKAGDVLWQGIRGSGAVRVRGSDGQYYDAMISFNGPDEIHLDISMKTPGWDQTWRRAGPDISGDWVLVGPLGSPGTGTRINVQGTDATVGYLAASAPRVVRVGRKLWQQIGASGGLQALGSDNKYHAATWSLVAPDRIRVDATQIAGGPGQIWVRPASVAAVQASLQNPPANPNAPGSNLTPSSNLPTPPTTPSTPPVPAAPVPACLATSMPHDQAGLRWGWGFTTSTRNDPLAETLGIRLYQVSGIPSGTGDAPLAIERFRVSGFQDGFVYVWGRRSRRFPWQEHRDLTPALLDQQNQAAMAGGMRLADFVAYDTPSGQRYAGVWERNIEGIDWKLEYDQTSQEFGQSFQTLSNSGYRLVDLEIYPMAGGVRYAGVWWASCDNSNWSELRGMARAEYQDSVDALAARGLRVIDFESYQTSAGQRYAAIWQQIPPGRAWAVRTDRSLNEFMNLHLQYVDEGLRLIDVESYDTPNGIRYGGVWGENDARYDMPFKVAVDDSIQAYRQRHAIPGISVVIMQDDEVIYRRGFGWADSAAAKVPHSGTIYGTASIAKVIGATLAARLQQQGRLDVTDTTANILDYLGSGHTHTIEQLLSKTGCIRHYDNRYADPNQAKTTDSQGNTRIVSRPMFFRWRRAAIDSLEAPLLPSCTPGQSYLYSTHGYTFVGGVLEEVLGEDIDQILTDEIFQPFGFQTMKLLGHPVVQGPNGPVQPFDRATPYTYSVSQRASVPISYEETSWKVLGGGLEVDALELARFGLLTLNGTIVSTQTRDNELWRSRTGSAMNYSGGGVAPQVGLGWNLRNVTAGGVRRRVAEHGGAGAGSRGQLQIWRDDGLIIAILTNQQNGVLTPGPAAPSAHPVRNLADGLADLVFSNPPPP